MGSGTSEHRTAIIVLVTAAIGLATATLTMWDSIFPSDGEQPSSRPTNTSRDAEAFAIECANALRVRDLDGLLERVSFPFSLDRERIISSKAEFREEFREEFLRKEGPEEKLVIKGIRVKSVADWIESGEIPKSFLDQFKLGVQEYDFLAKLIFARGRFGGDEQTLLIRNSGEKLSLAGVIEG